MEKRESRISRVKRSRNKLVYKRTEVGSEDTSGGNWFLYFLSVLLVGGIFYLVFLSGIFHVSDISIKGTKELKADDIKTYVEDALNSQISKGNLLLLDTSSLSHELKKKFGLKDIKVKKHYLNKLEVSLTEYVPSIQWFSSGKFYTVDEKGRVEGTSPINKKGIPVVCDNKNLKVEVGKGLVTGEFINFIKYISQNFQSDKTGQISKIEINESINEVVIISTKGFKVYFDTTSSPEESINNLMVVLKSDKVMGRYINYIDLRIKNKAFFQ